MPMCGIFYAHKKWPMTSVKESDVLWVKQWSVGRTTHGSAMNVLRGDTEHSMPYDVQEFGD